jgi:large subunit ribosomal protein L28
MSRICALTGKAVMSGHKVSHSQRKTNRKFLPNLHVVTLMSDVLGQSYHFRISTRALKTIEIKGGFDSYLLGTNKSLLSKKAQLIQKQLVAKLAIAKGA